MFIPGPCLDKEGLCLRKVSDILILPLRMQRSSVAQWGRVLKKEAVRVGNEAVAICLDKVLVNLEWKLLFNKALVIHEALIGSYHRPLILDLCVQAMKYRRVFHFESKWLLNPDCSDLIAKSWKKEDYGS
ncbi:conserved hypothetical protein [Ricinus communis]|uniref:RNase H type-1 domain-containing protein n=1 Tax=Ricinus communis TaxID=3988 RepID=B9RU49_RICCO|nr:conserved hypothetical protein [Ricinus communis]